MLATTTAPRPLGLHPIRALAAVVSAVLVVALLPASAEAAPPKRRTKVRADFTATSVVVGTAVQVTGKVRDRGKQKRRVLLQQKVAGGWRTVDRDRTTRRGRYSMDVPTDWLHSTKMRVLVKRSRRSAATTSRARRVHVVPGYTPVGSPESWTPVDKYEPRVNPCRRVSYGINFTRARQEPAAAAAAIHYAMAQAAQATGIRFTYVGETSAMPFDEKFRKRDPKLVFGWIPDAETPLDLGPAVAARGGYEKARWARDAKGRRVVEATRLGVIYDATEPYQTPEHMYHLTMHEVGHALGLGHVPEIDQHMTGGPEGYALPLVYSAGDLAGLSKVGLESGCLRPFRRRGHHRPVVVGPLTLP